MTLPPQNVAIVMDRPPCTSEELSASPQSPLLSPRPPWAFLPLASRCLVKSTEQVHSAGASIVCCVGALWELGRVPS